jgi:BRCA1-associated protein
VRQRRQKEDAEKLEKVLKEKQKAESRAEKATELARRLDKDLKAERAVTSGLMKNIDKMKEKVDQADILKGDFVSKIQELEEQLRDVMFYLETNKQIEDGQGAAAELVGGSIEVQVPGPSSKSKTKRKGKNG